LAGKKLHTPTGVVAEMWNHGHKMEEEVRKKGMTRPNISGREMVDLVPYIRSIQGRSSLVNQ
jgi:hypothetical protein